MLARWGRGGQAANGRSRGASKTENSLPPPLGLEQTGSFCIFASILKCHREVKRFPVALAIRIPGTLVMASLKSGAWRHGIRGFLGFVVVDSFLDAGEEG